MVSAVSAEVTSGATVWFAAGSAPLPALPEPASRGTPVSSPVIEVVAPGFGV